MEWKIKGGAWRSVRRVGGGDRLWNEPPR